MPYDLDDIPPPPSPASPAVAVRRWQFMAICVNKKAHAVYRPAELHTAICVGFHINDKKPGVFPYPSISTIVRETGYGRSTVIRHLNKLCAEPFPLFRRHLRSGKSTRYQPVTSATGGTGTSAVGETGTSATGGTGTRPAQTRTRPAGDANPSRGRDPNLVEQSINSLSDPERERDTPDGVPEPEGFLRAWKSYPARRRTGKAKALEVWTSRGLEQLTEGVLARVEYMTRTEWAVEDGKYAPKFPAWLEDVAPSEAPPQPDDEPNPEALSRWATSGPKIAAMAAEQAETPGDFMTITRDLLQTWPRTEELFNDKQLVDLVVELHEAAELKSEG